MYDWETCIFLCKTHGSDQENRNHTGLLSFICICNKRKAPYHQQDFNRMSYTYSLARMPFYRYYFKGKMPPRVTMTLSGISSYLQCMTVMVNTLVFDFDFLRFSGFRLRDRQLENTVFIGCINLITLNAVRHPEASVE